MFNRAVDLSNIKKSESFINTLQKFKLNNVIKITESLLKFNQEKNYIHLKNIALSPTTQLPKLNWN